MRSTHVTFTSGLVLMVISLGLLVFVHLFKDSDLEQEITLATTMGRIHQLDEQLASSAKMAILTRQDSDRAAYLRTEENVEELLDYARKTMPIGKAQALARQTHQAHQALVAMNRQALALCQQNACEQALELVTSKPYQHVRLTYVHGVDQAFFEFHNELQAQSRRAHDLLLILQGLMMISSILLMMVKRHLRLSQMHALQVTMRTVMDIVNNNLNRMQLLQLRWKKQTAISSQDIQEFREIVRETATQLKIIGDMTNFQTQGQGPTELLQWQSHRESAPTAHAQAGTQAARIA